jgi:gliding motility-associated-like protein
MPVCPHESLITTYTAIDSFIPCGGGTPVVVSDDVTVTLAGTLLVSIDSTRNVSCYNAMDGRGWAHATGGGSGLVAWHDVSTGGNTLTNFSNVAGLGPGVYAFVASDGTGCQRSDTTIITQPTKLNLITIDGPNPTSCLGNTGSVTISSDSNFVQGSPPYAYLWSNGPTTSYDANLGEGTVSVTITDSHSCTDSTTFTIAKTSTVLTLPVVVNARCHAAADGSIDANPSNGTPPYSFVWNDNQSKQTAIDLTAGNYTCIVTDSNGCSALASASVTDPADLTMNLNSLPVKCTGQSNGSIIAISTGGTSPYHFSATLDNVIFISDSAGVMSGLAPGSYTVILSDDNGCTKTAMINVSDATPDLFNVTTDSALCFGYNDGAIHIVDNTPVNEQYQYSIDSTDQYQFSSNFYNVSPGNHTITAINKNNCISTVQVLVPQPPPITVSVAPDTVVLALGQSLQVQAVASNTPNASYAWTPDFGLSCADCSNPMVSPYISQDYTITASTVNQTATCYGTAQLHVRVLPHQPVFIPNSFTPNNDGNNDVFEIYGASVKIVDLKIFNRWGELVFETRDQLAGWDGTFKGQQLPPGVFSYAATITFLDDTKQEKNGSITLLR